MSAFFGLNCKQPGVIMLGSKVTPTLSAAELFLTESAELRPGAVTRDAEHDLTSFVIGPPNETLNEDEISFSVSLPSSPCMDPSLSHEVLLGDGTTKLSPQARFCDMLCDNMLKVLGAEHAQVSDLVNTLNKKHLKQLETQHVQIKQTLEAHLDMFRDVLEAAVDRWSVEQGLETGASTGSSFSLEVDGSEMDRFSTVAVPLGFQKSTWRHCEKGF